MEETERSYRERPAAELRSMLRNNWYFDQTFGGSKPMRETKQVKRFFAALDAGDFEAGRDTIGPHLTAFVAAERELGGAPRPLLLDCDIQIIALVRALSRTPQA